MGSQDTLREERDLERFEGERSGGLALCGECWSLLEETG